MCACESLFKKRHTNEFVGKRLFALDAVLPSSGPKWGRWVYEKAKIPRAEKQLEAIGVFRLLGLCGSAGFTPLGATGLPPRNR